MAVDAILNIYKPKGITSFKCVAAVRKILGTKKVGHSGTLDPEAEGVLPICVGNYTRLSDEFLNFPKRYRGCCAFGVATDTQDIWGEKLETLDSTEALTDEMLQDAASKFIGDIEQLPPMYSAIKVGGVPMYKLARKGQEQPMDLKPRTVHIYDFKVEALSPLIYCHTLDCNVRYAYFEAECSRGTYMRTLCVDLGKALGLPACMSELTRVKYGPFLLENAVTLEQLSEAAGDLTNKTVFQDASCILSHLPKAELSENQYRRYRNGRECFIYTNQIEGEPGEEVCLWYKGVLFAIGRSRFEGEKIFLTPGKYLGGDQ